MEEPLTARVTRGQALAEVAREDLELYGAEELNERIALLQTEIERTQAQLARKQSGRDAAEALFSFKSD